MPYFAGVLATLSYHLKTSRPGLWFITLWLYIVATAGLDVWGQPVFWVGLVYFTFPFNYFIYSWNDWADRAIDALNPRKNNYLFGAVARAEHKSGILKANALVQLPFWAFFTWHTGFYMLWWLVALFFLNYIYNSPRVKLSGRPVLGLFVSLVYLLAFVLSVRLNGAVIPPQTYLYLVLFSFQSFLAGKIIDIEHNRLAGRKTLATVLGHRVSKLMLVLIIALETYLLINTFGEWRLASALAGFALLLVADALFVYKNKPYPQSIVRAFVVFANIAAIATMVWLWLSGSLV